MAQIPVRNFDTFYKTHPDFAARYNRLPAQIQQAVQNQFASGGLAAAQDRMNRYFNNNPGVDPGANANTPPTTGTPPTGPIPFDEFLAGHPRFANHYNNLPPQVQQNVQERYAAAGPDDAMARMNRYYVNHPDQDPRNKTPDAGTDTGTTDETVTDEGDGEVASKGQMDALFPTLGGFNNQYYTHAREEGMADLEKLMAARGLTNSGAEVQANEELISDIGAEQAKEQYNQAHSDAELLYQFLKDNADRQITISQAQHDRMMDVLDRAIAQDPSGIGAMLQQAMINAKSNIVIGAGEQWGEGYPDPAKEKEQEEFQEPPGEVSEVNEAQADTANQGSTVDEGASIINEATTGAMKMQNPDVTTTGQTLQGTGQAQTTAPTTQTTTGRIPRAGTFNRFLANRPNIQANFRSLTNPQQQRVRQTALAKGFRGGLRQMQKIPRYR